MYSYAAQLILSMCILFLTDNSHFTEIKYNKIKQANTSDLDKIKKQERVQEKTNEAETNSFAHSETP